MLLNRFKSALKRFLKSISCPYVMLSYFMLCYDYCKQSTCKRIQGSLGFQISLLGIRITRYWIPDSQCQWKLDSRFQSLVGFRISSAELPILLTSKNFLDSGDSIRPSMGRSYTLSHYQEKLPLHCDINGCDDIAVIIVRKKPVASTAIF